MLGALRGGALYRKYFAIEAISVIHAEREKSLQRHPDEIQSLCWKGVENVAIKRTRNTKQNKDGAMF